MTALLIAFAAWRQSVIRETRVLPALKDDAALAPSASH
jgi:hypothetical protein